MSGAFPSRDRVDDTRQDDERVRALYARSARDLTPTRARHIAHVLYAPSPRDAELSALCASLLSDAERQKQGRLGAEYDRAQLAQRRAFRRFCGAVATASLGPLSEIAFEETENGRPHLPQSRGLHFSFASCRSGFLGAWSSTHAIGVDIEDRTTELEASELARRFFSAAEAEVVQRTDGPERLRTFCRYWTAKEAALKSIGEGLPYGLDTFEFALKPTPHVIRAPEHFGGPPPFGVHVIEDTGSCATLVARSLIGTRRHA